MLKNPRLVFYIGFAIYLAGYLSQFSQLKFLRILILVGTLVSMVAISVWYRTPNFKDKFTREKGENALTYFWNKMVIRLWSAMFFCVMLFSSISYLVQMIF